MLGNKSNRNLFQLASIGILSSVFNLGIALSGNSIGNESATQYCGGSNSSAKAECTHVFDSGNGGSRVLKIEKIDGNGGNVFVRVYNPQTNQTILEANPGVGGRETFSVQGKGVYAIQLRLHNPGSSVTYVIERGS